MSHKKILKCDSLNKIFQLRQHFVSKQIYMILRERENQFPDQSQEEVGMTTFQLRPYMAFYPLAEVGLPVSSPSMVLLLYKAAIYARVIMKN